jgi:hypothetical protein
MNKIYKVIWSKVRNCYVAVSEIAKRNGKSCTSVNCGAKANRRCVGMVLALALSLSLTGGGVAWAEDVPSNQTINSPTNKDYVITGSGVKFIVDSGGIINSVTSSTSGNTIEVKAGGQVTGTTSFNYGVIGGQNNNNVTISGAVEYGAYGGFSESNSVTGNTVEVKNGTVTNAYGGGVGGGSFPTDTTDYDTGTVVRGNTITISGTGKVTNYLYGGSDNHGYSTITGNTVNIKDNSEVASVSGGDAYKGIVSGNSVNIYNGTVTGSIYGGNSGSSNISGNDVLNNTVTIYNGTFTSWTISGGDSNWGSANNNVVDIRDGVFNVNYITGGMASYAGGTANNNTVEIVGGTFTTDSSYLDIWGGSSSQSDACDNRVDLSNFSVSNVQIRGGYVSQDSISTPHFAQRNNIILNNTTVNGNIYGGYIKYIWNAGSKITNNTVTLNGVTGNINLYGGYYDGKYSEVTDPIDTVTGNKLILQKAGNVVSSINNFETIQLVSPLTWSNGKGNTVLTAKFNDSSFSILDISPIANNLKNTSNSKGTMTILAGSTSSSRDFGTQGFTLKYGTNSGDKVTLNSANPKKIITAGTSGSETTFTNGVKFKSYKEKEYTVSLANNYKNVLYTIADNVVTIDLGTAKWGTPRSADATKNFVTTTTINASDLNFTFDSESDKSNLRSNSKNTLLSNATGMIAGIIPNYGTGKTNHTQTIQYTASENGVSLTGTLTGNVVTLTDAIEFQATNMTLNSVNLAGWDGTNLLTAPVWTKNPTNISVTTAGLSTAALTAIAGIPVNQSREILRRAESQYFSNVQFDSASANNNAYKSHSFSNEQSSGSDITFTGTQNKGVTVGNWLGRTNNALVYKVDYKNVNTITLGGMTWGTSRTPGSSDYQFGTVAGVDASGLTFNFSNNQAGALKAGSSMTLLSNATGLSAGRTVTYGTGKTNHTQTITNYNPGNGISLNGTLTGTVSTTTQRVNYSVTGMALDSVNLAGWNGASSNVPNVPADWTNNLGNESITAAGFTEPDIEAGEWLGILTATTDNYFNINQITGAKKYSSTAFVNDTANGVTFSGNHYGGVNVEDTGKTLKYYAETKDVTDITLGNVEWDAGRTAGDLYIFNNVNSIDATGFSFSNPEAVSGSMYLLPNATGLAAGAVADILHTQADFTTNMGNGTAITATLTGTISTAEAGKVKYTATGTTISTIDLSGWDVSTSSAVPAGWTLKKNSSNEVEATVETANMNATMLSNLPYGSSVPILTATGTAYFDGIKINGANAWNGSGSIVDTDNSGVAIVGTTTGTGVKVDDANKNQIVYQKSKEDITKLTLGGITFAAGTKARTFDNTYDLTAAPIVARDNLFTSESRPLMETGDTMTLVDATGAIKNTSNETLSTFNGGTSKSYVVNFTDTIKSNSIIKSDSIKFTGTHTDTLSQEDDTATSTKKSLLKYEVGAKMVTKATLSGAIDWRDGGTYYTNGVDVNENGKDATYTFDGDTAVVIAGVQFSTTEDPIAGGKTKSMTLLEGVTGVVETNISGTPAFGVALTQNNTKLDAKATGSASVSGNDVIYSVNGVAIDKINVTSIAKAADTVPTGWTLAKDSSDNVIATVETDGLVVASPSGLEPGETKVIIEAASGSTAFFKDVSVNGSHAWKVDGSTITSDLDIGGVAITGTQTKGGVKVNEANTNQIIYEESKKSINTLTLGSVTFANDDGTAATVARTFDKTYDVSTATINADDLAFANSDIMETGNSMRIVDASAAIPNAISNKKLPAFTEQTKKVAFADTITGKNLTLKGAHTDTLSQDAAQTTLTYTVGDKVVSSAKLAGDITWNDGGTYYANGSDVNQNGTKATYTFDGNSAVDISNVSFSATADPLVGATKTMTLLKGVTGVLATKVSGTPSFTVALDQTNTKLDAKATGASGVSGNDVTFTVSGVTLDKITVKGANGTADKVPANWTVAAGVTIETDSMTVPELAAGTHVDILQSDTDGFFAKVAINGANAYGNTQDAFTESDAAKSVTIAGTQDKGVTLNTEKKHLIYKAGTLDVASVTLGLAEWKKGATVFERSGAEYNYAGVAALGTDGFVISYASPETVATGESMTLLQANATLKDMAEQVKKTSYSYTPVTGVTIDANITGKLATSGGAVTYTATENQASKLTFTNVDWKDSGALLTRPSNITFAGADVDTAKIHFQNVKELDANRKMTLVSDFGDSVGTITGSKYTVGAGLEGEGAASLSGSDLVFTTKTGARDLAAQEQTHNTLMVMEAGMAVLAAGREHLGQAMVGLADPQNAGSDGTRIGASMGGGWSRYKTGSHVDSNNWNVAVAVGSKRELKKGSLEWGVFGEYGKSNYTLHSDAGRGDGDSHYAGGGLMAKWTNKHDVYTEASVRLGRLSDTANNLLRDAAGNGYGYDVHANYFGAHVGIGKIINYKGGKSLDVYGKYFYTKRDGVDFASGGNNYSLDSVASSILRVGARYGTTDKKWNWYGGLAYEYEFDGKSDGMGIRAASVKGGSVRGEIGMRMNATKTNPWQTDISIYGYGGKHRGFGGSVNVAYMF